MNVLIVVNQGPQRRDFLEDIVRRTIQLERVDKLDRAADHVNGNLLSALSTQDPFHLVLHHCGGVNREYPDFVNKYQQLCKENQWRSAIILFSGDTDKVKEANTSVAANDWVCAVRQEDVESNLAAFLASWDRGSTPPWHILRTGSPHEPALQALSALLPFGLLLETMDSLRDAANEIAKPKYGEGMPKFERALQLWFAGLLETGTNEKDALTNEHPRMLGKLGGDGFLTKIEKGWEVENEGKEEQVKGLPNCATIGDWNKVLTFLREELLERAKNVSAKP